MLHFSNYAIIHGVTIDTVYPDSSPVHSWTQKVPMGLILEVSSRASHIRKRLIFFGFGWRKTYVRIGYKENRNFLRTNENRLVFLFLRISSYYL